MAKRPDRSAVAVWALTVLAVLVIALLVAAPIVLERQLRQALARNFPDAQRVDVQVVAPAWAVVTGALRVVTVDVRQATLGQLPVDHVSLRLEDVAVDPRRILRGDPAGLQRVRAGQGEVTMTQKDLEMFLAAAKGVQRATARLEEGSVAIEGDVRVATLDLRVRLEGRLVVASPTTVDLHVQTLTVSGVQIPPEIGNVLAAGLNPLLTLEGLPVSARIESVTVEGGQARLAVRVGGVP